MGKIVFITGGVRSGKSSHAVNLARDEKSVLFVATAIPFDEEMDERIQKHREQRPADWRTVEATRGALTGHVKGDEGVLVLDCITLYVARRLTEEAPALKIVKEVEEAVEEMRGGFELSVLVSNEVGSGVVPDNALARSFTEVLGQANHILAARADEVLLMVSGIPVKVK
jgi:adenosylcobinamide kinase/adenosylcobinamide-phosphate guanylyltransferase